MRYLPILLVMVLLLAACGASQKQIEAAIAQTKAAQDAMDLLLQQTMVAETHAAQSAIDQKQKETQQALELTLAVQSVAPPLEVQIQTAIAQTQSAEGLSQQETQAALDLTTTPTPPGAAIFSEDFADAYIYTHGWTLDHFFFTIQLSQEVKGKYHAEIGGRKFKCSVVEKYPNRLYCIGPKVSAGYRIIQLYEDLPSGGANIVFAKAYDIPFPFMTPTKFPTPTATKD
jgi:hypothetical protein